ncbi:hypothetical protein ASE86_11200 [Sphingomonas sp. Leaf33]|nr:hypothetical protein ASE86_11200 [Sphingomonas sp. Leaf33]
MATAPAPAAIYQGITLLVVSNNAQSGDRITINLGERGGKNVAWSTGQDFATSSGIQLSSTGGGSVPVSSFAITAEKITFMLAPSDSGSSTQFRVSAFLAADPSITEFSLSLTSDENSQVQAALSMQEPATLGPNPTVFDWPGTND